MRVNEFMVETFRLPAALLKGAMGLIFGLNQFKEDGSKDKDNSFPGLVGVITGSLRKILKWVAKASKAFTGLTDSHKNAISAAFWLSLLAAGVAALTVAFWPAALAVVVNFSIAGYSLAALLGTNFALQVGVIAAAAALATTIATYTVTSVSNLVDFLISCCAPKKTSANDSNFVRKEINPNHPFKKLSPNANNTNNANNVIVDLNHAPPVYTRSLHQSPAKNKEAPATQDTVDPSTPAPTKAPL